VEAGFPTVEKILGVDGRQLTSEEIKRVTSLYTRYNIAATPQAPLPIGCVGEVGCYLSHVKIWKQIVKKKMKSCVVFEDDVLFNPNFTSDLKEYWNTLQNKEEIGGLFFGYINRITNPLRCQDIFAGLQGYYITYAGAKKMLERWKPLEVPVDLYMGMVCKEDPERTPFYFTSVPLATYNNFNSSIDREWGRVQQCPPADPPVDPSSGGSRLGVWIPILIIFLLLVLLLIDK